MGKIVEKHPLTDQEKAILRWLMLRPEDYVGPKDGARTCGVCGEKFEDIPALRGNPMIPALDQFADHTAMHNPTAGQWAVAHQRIRDGQERRTQ